MSGAIRKQAHSTLADELAATMNGFMSGLSPGAAATVADAFERLMASSAGIRAVHVEDYAPEFRLPRVQGGDMTLSDALEDGPVVLSFYRGGWCPFCSLEFAALRRHLSDFRELGANLIAISPELPEHGRKTVQELGLDFPVLSDVGNQVARSWGLVMTVDESLRPLYREWGIDLPVANGDESHELPIPATYVIDRNGVVRAAVVDRNYTHRMEPADILSVLRTFES